jgi:hypothetical protein
VSARDSDPDLVRTLRELGRAAVPVPEPQRAEYQRERVVRAIKKALVGVELTRRPSHRVAIWLSAAGLALAVGGAGTFAGRYWFSNQSASASAAATPSVAAESVVGEVTLRREGVPRRAVVGDVLRGGDVVTTAEKSRVSIGIEAGSAELGASGELEFAPPSARERRLRLGAGTVDVDLPTKLADGRKLVVETPDVDVVVVGTAFSVDVDRSTAAVATHVAVRRGTVWIMQGGRQKAVLVAGQSWKTPTQAPVEAAPTAEPVAVRTPKSTADSARGEGTLAEENKLFQSALSARNAGDPVAAADAFGQLLARYPRSVLSEQALAERFRALERAGRTSSAVAAARRYLAQYPRGFARVDAERIAQGPGGDR